MKLEAYEMLTAVNQKDHEKVYDLFCIYYCLDKKQKIFIDALPCINKKNPCTILWQNDYVYSWSLDKGFEEPQNYESDSCELLIRHL